MKQSKSDGSWLFFLVVGFILTFSSSSFLFSIFDPLKDAVLSANGVGGGGGAERDDGLVASGRVRISKLHCMCRRNRGSKVEWVRRNRLRRDVLRLRLGMVS